MMIPPNRKIFSLSGDLFWLSSEVSSSGNHFKVPWFDSNFDFLLFWINIVLVLDFKLLLGNILILSSFDKFSLGFPFGLILVLFSFITSLILLTFFVKWLSFWIDFWSRFSTNWNHHLILVLDHNFLKENNFQDFLLIWLNLNFWSHRAV